MSQRSSDERTEQLIALARSNPQLASRLLAELPPEARASLVAALARPPRKAVPRGTSHQTTTESPAASVEAGSALRAAKGPTAGPGLASTNRQQTAYSAQLNAFAKSVGRVS